MNKIQSGLLLMNVESATAPGGKVSSLGRATKVLDEVEDCFERL